MNNKTHGEHISKYAIKIKYEYFNYIKKENKSRQGSGVLVKVSKNTIYLLTARHNFKESDDDEFFDVDINEVKQSLNKIYISNDSKTALCSIKDILYYEDNLDLIVFEISGYDDILNLPILSIMRDSEYKQKEHIYYGYPNGKDGSPVDNLRHLGSKEKDKNIFRLRSDLNIINQQFFSGYSGSGVFIEHNSIYYLVGIIIKVNEKSNNFEVIDLLKAIDNINKKLNKNQKIKIEENILDIISSDKMYTRMIRRNQNRNNFLIKKAKNIFSPNHRYKDLTETKQTKKLVNYIKNYENKFKELETKYFEELADTYLIGAFILGKFEDNKNKAIGYLEKAMHFKPEYIRYIEDLKNTDSSENLKLGKIAFVDKKYNEAKEYLNNRLEQSISKQEKINIYNMLVVIYIEINEKSRLISSYQILLELYNKDKKYSFEIATIYYELSILYDNDEKKIGVWNEGFLFVKNIYDTTSLELQYKYWKQWNRIEGKEDVYYNLKSKLEELSNINPKYKDILTKIHSSEKEKFELEEELKSNKKIRNSKNIRILSLHKELKEEKAIHEKYKCSKSKEIENLKIINSKLKNYFNENLELQDKLKRMEDNISIVMRIIIIIISILILYILLTTW